jgi:energy-coupling factor transporter ATP-binding protein EcfA2
MPKKVKTWQELETIVRMIASALYDSEAVPKEVDGVKCDVVIEKEEDYIILIEISKENTLDKMRTDLAKFANLRQYYMHKNIHAKCIFICETELNPSIIETAKGSYVEAMSVHQFAERLFDFNNYLYLRKDKPFGSAVDPITGENDIHKYVPVKYSEANSGKISLEDIVKFVREGKYIVLLGEYGCGKSRCLMELFLRLADDFSEFYKYPIHINLKENWGLNSSYEIMSRHFNSLGLSKYLDSIMKMIKKKTVCYLLDGFDEVGAQTWSDSPEKLKEIRRKSLSGIKDIIASSSGGAIISGREHYFKSDDEMISCLGLENKNPIIIKCMLEFSEDEVVTYLGEVLTNPKLPEWLPKKPLICQLLKNIDFTELTSLFSCDASEFEFFEIFIDLVCEREAKINNALDKDIIKEVLLEASLLVRRKENRYGPITINELNNIFERVTGNTVADETAIILQRLPGLGRIDGNSHDRQFIDDYILSGLQAISIINIIANNKTEYINIGWNNLLSESSIRYLSISITDTFKTNVVAFFLNNTVALNKYLLGDILSSLSIINEGTIDLKNKEIINIQCPSLDLANNSLKNFTLLDGYIQRLIIDDKTGEGIKICGVCIEIVEGISSETGCPSWFRDNLVEHYQEINTLPQIKKTKLSESQKLFIIITRKLFMQPGAGRKESALFKGYDSSEQKKLVNKIIQMLEKNDFIQIAPGREGKLYIPNRKVNARIKSIHDELLLSNDDIWKQISRINSSE